MTSFSHSELSLQLSWSPRVNGKQVAVPGFYLRGMYANEGTAMEIVPGTYENGYGGNGSLLTHEAILDVFAALRHNELLLPPFVNHGPLLAEFQRKEQLRAYAAKRSRLDALKAEVAALEAEVGDALDSPE